MEHNLLSLVTLWLDNICQIKIKVLQWQNLKSFWIQVTRCIYPYTYFRQWSMCSRSDPGVFPLDGGLCFRKPVTCVPPNWAFSKSWSLVYPRIDCGTIHQLHWMVNGDRSDTSRNFFIFSKNYFHNFSFLESYYKIIHITSSYNF